MKATGLCRLHTTTEALEEMVKIKIPAEAETGFHRVKAAPALYKPEVLGPR